MKRIFQREGTAMLVLLWALLLLPAARGGACEKRILAYLPLLDDVPEEHRAGFVEKHCMEQRWFQRLYETSKRDFEQWRVLEQEEMGLDDVLAVESLRDCFRSFLNAKNEHGTERLDFLDRHLEFKQAGGDKFTSLSRACGLAQSDFLSLGISEELFKQPKAALFKNGGECGKGLSKVPDNLFQGIVQTITGALEDDFEEFFDSKTFLGCKGKKQVRKDLLSYGRLASRYCADQKSIYARGTKSKKQLLMQRVLRNWARKCKHFASYVPRYIVMLQRNRNEYEPPLPDEVPRVKT